MMTMKGRILASLGVLAIAAGALALRLPRLDQRPMHTDEAVQAVKSGILLETGTYTYDPDEFHGPALHYLAWPFMRLKAGRDFAATTEATFRVVPALIGAGLVLLHLLLGRGLGWLAAWVAAGFCALSPAMVYYSRYYIPETLLVFFTLAAVLAGWRYAQTGRPAWAVATGLFVGLMYATKETCVFAFASLAVAWAGVVLWRRRTEGAPLQLRSYFRPKVLAVAGGVAFVVAFLLFSGLFTNLAGPFDSLRTYAIWGRRGAAGGLHEHPWHFYLQRLLYVRYPYGPVWTEAWLVGLALVGVVCAVSGKGVAKEHLPLARFFSLYTVLMTAGYALIPYKTPWCMLGFVQGMCVLAGIGCAALFAYCRSVFARALSLGLLLVGLVHLGWQAFRATSFEFDADRRNPYVYAHPARDVVRLGEMVTRVATVVPQGRELLVKVISPHYWPLPWYFRALPQVGYWHELPEDVEADVIVTAPEFAPAVEAKLARRFQRMSYGLHPPVVLLVYVRSELWAAFLERYAGGARAAP